MQTEDSGRGRDRKRSSRGARSRVAARPRTTADAAAAKGEPDDLDLGSDKLYFKIGEVAEIVGVPAYVLRYWESEFKAIRPQKSRTQQRVHRFGWDSPWMRQRSFPP